MRNRQIFVIAFAYALMAPTAEAQRTSYNAPQSGGRSRVNTPYFGNQGTPGYGNYGASGQAGYGRVSPYQLSPYLNYRTPVATPALPPVTGTVEKYSDVEYGKIVQMAVEAGRQNNPSGATATERKSIVENAAVGETGQVVYRPVGVNISDVLDRGIMLLSTGEELRLRGVTIPSVTGSDEISRLYAREAMQALRNLTQGKEVYVVLDDPLRDSTGRLLGTLILVDGTELNRRMLELGYGTLKVEDFTTGVNYSDLETALESAKIKRLGLWSKGY